MDLRLQLAEAKALLELGQIPKAQHAFQKLAGIRHSHGLCIIQDFRARIRDTTKAEARSKMALLVVF